MSNTAKLKLFFSAPQRVFKLTRLLSMSAYDLMKPYLKSQNLVEFYDKLCGSYAYTSMKETPALMALTMFTDNHAGGTYYVAGSAQTYSNLLEKAIERYGGTLLYDNLVEEIVFENRRACGVKLANGTIIKGQRIVSDTTVWNLYNRLIPKEESSQEQRAWANAQIPTYPATVLYVAVDKKVFPEDINAVEYYVRDLTQIEMGDITLYIPSVDDFSLGPPSEHIITMFSPSPDQDWPHPSEKEYQSIEYQERKLKQAEEILNEVEKRIPDFKSGIKQLHIASPSTIERYTLKNGGCVGGPKQMIGQDLTRRLSGKTDWPGLFACGDSTTMGMGMPAVTASGFGAANVILRELGRKEFHRKDFEHEFVTYVESNPAWNIPETIDGDPDNASLIARECQHCEDQICRKTCPAGIDIPGFIRRIEARNYVGAARLIREKNPLAEICGHVCPSGRLCESVCHRLSFDSKPVKIRELHRWVAEYTGNEGFSTPMIEQTDLSVCVVGAGPAGLSCAHYLSRLGYSVVLYDESEEPGGYLHELVDKGILPREVLKREVSGLMTPQIKFNKNWTLDEDSIDEVLDNYAAVFLTVKTDSKVELSKALTGGIGYSDEAKYEVAHAVAEGRRAAKKIHEMIMNY
jgi:prolycopene isomerase